MRGRWAFLMMAAVMLGPSFAGAQVTRVASFENYVEGDQWFPSFTDVPSGITFRSPVPNEKFIIDYSSTFFGGGHYLNSQAAAGGDVGGLAPSFGFTGDLPSAANRVGVEITCGPGPRSTIVLRAFNGQGGLIGQAVGPTGSVALSRFVLEVSSSQFDISRFQMSAGPMDVGYDNISYSIIPEPTGVVLIGMLALHPGRRRCRERR